MFNTRRDFEEEQITGFGNVCQFNQTFVSKVSMKQTFGQYFLPYYDVYASRTGKNVE